jgi:hypothetical protein
MVYGHFFRHWLVLKVHIRCRIAVQFIYNEIVETLAIICEYLRYSFSLYTHNVGSFFLYLYMDAPIYKCVGRFCYMSDKKIAQRSGKLWLTK